MATRARLAVASCSLLFCVACGEQEQPANAKSDESPSAAESASPAQPPEMASPAARGELSALPGVSEVCSDLPPTGNLRGGRVGFATLRGPELEQNVRRVDEWLDRAAGKTCEHE